MAAAVPLIAGAFLGPVGAAIVTVAFSVTGISKKINDAAVSVFGEDLVKIGNLAAIAYGAYQAFADPTAAVAGSAEGMAETVNLADAANAADALTAVDPMAAVEAANAAEATQQVASALPVETAVVRSAMPAPAPAAVAPAAAAPAAVTPAQPTVMDAIRAPATATATPSANYSVAPTSQGATATASQGLATRAAGDVTARGAEALSTNTGKNFFDRLVGVAEKNPLITAGVISGVGNAYTGASARAQQQAQYDEQIKRLDRLRGIGSFRLKG